MDGLLAITRYWFNLVKIVIATESTEEHENIFLSGYLFFRVFPWIPWQLKNWHLILKRPLTQLLDDLGVKQQAKHQYRTQQYKISKQAVFQVTQPGAAIVHQQQQSG